MYRSRDNTPDSMLQILKDSFRFVNCSYSQCGQQEHSPSFVLPVFVMFINANTNLAVINQLETAGTAIGQLWLLASSLVVANIDFKTLKLITHWPNYILSVN